MVARAQRLTVLALLTLALLWLVVHAASGRWLVAILGALLIVNVQALILAVEFFVLLPFVNRGDTAAPRPGFAQVLRAWGREVLTAHAVFGWQQPFRSQHHPDTIDAPDAPGRRAVVLVHGYLCNRGLWNRWLPMLHAARVPYIAITMEPPFASIDGYAAAIEAAILRATAATGVPPLLIGHSMGGVAIRAWWRSMGVLADQRVHSAITIGSPHQGTFTARLARGLNARQMRLRGDWLGELARAEGESRNRRFTCFFSHCDNIVMPASAATLPGADNRHVAGEPHVALAFAPEVIGEALRRLSPDSA
jgi:pimeloyl-ACP methyl ester carboxylesterase